MKTAIPATLFILLHLSRPFIQRRIFNPLILRASSFRDGASSYQDKMFNERNIHNRRRKSIDPNESIEAIEARLKARWGGIKQSEFYDVDDEGYEEDVDEDFEKYQTPEGKQNDFLFRRPEKQNNTSFGDQNGDNHISTRVRLRPQPNLRPAFDHGLPLTLEAVAQRYRSRMEDGGGTVSSLFVQEGSPHSTFNHLIELGCQILISSPSSPCPSSTTASSSKVLSDFTGTLLSNLAQELSGRFVESDSKPVDSTSIDDPSLSFTSGHHSLSSSYIKYRKSKLSDERRIAEEKVEHEAVLQTIIQSLRPTKVQVGAMKKLVDGVDDVVLCAPTGSGKTLAYSLPLLLRGLLAYEKSAKGPKIIIVCPGRELSVQCATVISNLLSHTNLTCLPLIGGANINRQMEKLKKAKPFVVVGTPGRLLDLIQNRNKLSLKNVVGCVLDESDEMLSPPHRQDLEGLIGLLPRSHCQLVAASATSGNERVVENLSDLFKHRQHTIQEPQQQRRPVPFVLDQFENDDVNDMPVSDNLAAMSPLPPSVEHLVLLRPLQKHIDTLKSILLSEPEPGAVLVFVNDIIKAKTVCEKLENMKIIVAPLFGETSKEDRALIISRLNSGRLRVVVSTEMAARGLDIPRLTHVINFDLPTDAAHYIHRAGRVGRTGRAGIVISLATTKSLFILHKFAEELHVVIHRMEMFAKQLLLMPDDV